MVLNCDTKGLVHLADGSVCGWDDEVSVITPAVRASAALSVKACPSIGLHVVLTPDGRILAGLVMDNPLTDITSLLPDAVRDELIDAETEIHVSTYDLTVKTRNSISFYYIGESENGDAVNVRLSMVDILPCAINLSSFIEGHGLIRTSDNSTYLVDGNYYLSRSCKPIDIYDAANIREIVCADGFTMLIMNNGTVRACGLFSNAYSRTSWFPSESNPFVQIKFPEVVSVVKIVTNGRQVFYITTTGQCYYSINASQHANSPVLVKAFTDYFIENIFITDDAVIAQDDGNKLCLAWLIYPDPPCSVMQLSSCTISGLTKTKALPFFDDKDIVSIDQVYDKLYFTTSMGRMYSCTVWDLMHSPQIDEIAFFIDNPVMVECKAARIQSAASALNDA